MSPPATNLRTWPHISATAFSVRSPPRSCQHQGSGQWAVGGSGAVMRNKDRDMVYGGMQEGPAGQDRATNVHPATHLASITAQCAPTSYSCCRIVASDGRNPNPSSGTTLYPLSSPFPFSAPFHPAPCHQRTCGGVSCKSFQQGAHRCIYSYSTPHHNHASTPHATCPCSIPMFPV